MDNHLYEPSLGPVYPFAPEPKKKKYFLIGSGIALAIVVVVATIVGVVQNRFSNLTRSLDFNLAASAAPSASPLVYGTNLAMDNSQDQFLTNPGAAAALQNLHAQLVRMPIRDVLTSADYTTALTKIKQIGATPLLIVNGAAYSKGDPYPSDSALLTIAKKIFPTQTVYVDYGNEEDLAGTSVQKYVSGQYGWNNEIPRLKQITGTNFKYGGPVNFQYNESYIDTFVATANPSPDYIVWHAYAGSCGHNTGTGVPDSQAHMLASIDNWNAHIQQISTDFATQNNGAHKGMPIIIDEWNYASDLGSAGSASPCYSSDQAFINAFFSKALNMFIADGKYGVIGAAEYEAFVGKDESMIDGGNAPTLQGLAFKASYESNIGNAPTPPPSPSPSPATYACSSLSATPDGANPLMYTAVAASQVTGGATLTNGSFAFGDGSAPLVVQPSSAGDVTATHTYGKAGTYTIAATLNFTANGQPASAHCSTQVTVSSSPLAATYACSALTGSPSATNAASYNFTALAQVQSATLTSANFSFGDGQNAYGIRPAAASLAVVAAHTYARSGSYPVSATLYFLANGATKTAACTTQVSVSLATPTTSGTVAADTFNRANQGGWGTASNGALWGGDANNLKSIFTIKNGVGVLASTSGNSYTGLLGPWLSNAQIVFTGRISNFQYSNFGGVLRFQNDHNWYKAYLTSDDLVIQKEVNGTSTILKSVSFPSSPNTNFDLRFQAVGNTLSAKAWPASSAEPANWTATVTDSSFQSGYEGLRGLAQNGIVIGYYNYAAYSL